MASAPATYSSWLNHVELWFASIERDVIARGIFNSVSDLAANCAATSTPIPQTLGPFNGNNQIPLDAFALTIPLRQSTSRLLFGNALAALPA